MPYEEDSNPKEDQNQLEVTPDQMETEDPATAEGPIKKGMGIAVGPGNYQPAPPRYMRADEDSEDGQDTDEEEDIKAAYLALKQTSVPKSSQDEQTAQAALKGKTPQQKTHRSPQVKNQSQNSWI